MHIETRAYFRRLARTAICFLLGVALVCGAAGGQAGPPTVTTGSLVTVPSDGTWGQIFKILFFKGNVLALDAGTNQLYQLSPGATSWQNLAPSTSDTPGILGTSNGFTAVGMTMDAVGTLYITIRFSTNADKKALFWRVPYDPVANTWHVTASTGWGGGENGVAQINDVAGINGKAIQLQGGSDDVQFVNSPAMDGSGTLYWMAETPDVIYSVPVDAQGNLDVPTVVATNIISGFSTSQGKIAVDANGNLYFLENRATKNTGRVSGVFFIPAGKTGITAPAGATVESTLTRLDPGNTIVYGGLTLDEAGNLYLPSENNSSYNETFNGVWMIPNECGSPSAVTGDNVTTCLNYNDISLVAPVGTNAAPSIDSRGYIWIPTYQDWSPSGSGPVSGVFAIAVWAPGSLNLGAPFITSVNPNAGVTGDSVTITGTNFGLSQGTSAVSFGGVPATVTSWSGTSIVAVVPAFSADVVAPGFATDLSVSVTVGSAASNGPTYTVGGTPSTPTTAELASTVFVNFNRAATFGSVQFAQAGGGTDFGTVSSDPDPPGTPPTTPVSCTPGKLYAAQSTCQVWVGLAAHAPGAVSGQFTLLDSDGNVISGSKVYLAGTGQGAEAAMLGSPAQTAIASGLQSPAQVAADSAGNTYVADPSLHKVLSFAAGSSNATGTQVVNSLTAPTGVAVDGSGDVYIADSGKVIEIPAVSGVPVASGRANIAQGLGNNLSLAVDGVGNVFVADPDNSRVVKIPNPAAANLVANFNATLPLPTTITVGTGFTQPTAVAVDAPGNLYVADGSTLWEVTPWDVQTAITNNLNAPVTGLAVDASGSVIVSQKDGIIRIPAIGGILTVNGTGPLVPSIVKPNGVALDQLGNLYVSDMTGDAANLWELAVTGAVDFGVGLTPSVLASQDLGLFNIGNASMMLTGAPSFTGSDIADFSFVSPSGATACDSTGATLIATGTSCSLGLGFIPPAEGTYTGDQVTIPTNAANVVGGNITATLTGQATANLEPTQTAVSLDPSASIVYPGATTATVTVTPDPDSTTPPNDNVPLGTVTLVVNCTDPGCTTAPIQQTKTLTAADAGTSAAFSLSGIQGGNYSAIATYSGSIAQLMQKSTSAPVAFTVLPAMPLITLSTPLGVSPNSTNGIYYVQEKQVSYTLTANVSSLVGTPTGTVTFMNGSQVEGTSPIDANGNAVFTTFPLADGTYSLTAVYSSDQNFATAASSAVPFQIIPSSVLISAASTSVTTSAGTPVAATLQLQSLAGFSTNGSNIVCDNSTLPYYSECTFSNPSPAICDPQASTGTPCTGITSTVVTISSNIPVNLPPSTTASLRPHESGSSPLIPAGIFGLGLFGLVMRRKAIFNGKLLNSIALSLMLIGVALGFGGCTNSAYTKTPPPLKFTTKSGTYSVSIKVTDPASGVTQSLPFTLTLTIK